MGNRQSKIRLKEKKPSNVGVPSNVSASPDVKVASEEEHSKTGKHSDENDNAAAPDSMQAEIATLEHVPSPPPSPDTLYTEGLTQPPVPSAPLIPYLPILVAIRDYYKLQLEIFALDVMKRAERGEASIMTRVVDGVECRIVKVWYNPTGEAAKRVIVIEKGQHPEGPRGRMSYEVVFIDNERVEEGQQAGEGEGEGEQAAEVGRN